MRRKHDHYEYITRYVDDLTITSNNPKEITDVLENSFGFTLKGTVPIKYHLGCDFFRDSNDILCMAPLTYIGRMMDTYLRVFGSKPNRNYSSPLERDDHPELDTTKELDINGIKIYQSLIGASQWVVSLGRFDISVAVMTMSRFRSSPREGHMERVKRIYSYLAKMKHGILRFRTDSPNLSDISSPEYSWEKTVYGNFNEEIPSDAPKELGKSVKLISYVDANLFHDVTTGRSVTGILHFFNKTLIDYYSKRQATVETSIYG